MYYTYKDAICILRCVSRARESSCLTSVGSSLISVVALAACAVAFYRDAIQAIDSSTGIYRAEEIVGKDGLRCTPYCMSNRISLILRNTVDKYYLLYNLLYKAGRKVSRFR